MEIRVGTVYSIVFAVIQILDIFALSYAKWSTVNLSTQGSPKNIVPEIDLGLFQICCIYVDNNNDNNTNTTELLSAPLNPVVRNQKSSETRAEIVQRECIAWQKFYNAENQTTSFGDTNCPRYDSQFWLYWPEDFVFLISSMAVVASFLKIIFLSLSYLPMVVRSNMFFIVGVLNLASLAFQVFVCVGWTIVVSQTEDDVIFEGTLHYSIVFWMYVISTAATFIFSFLMIYTYIQLRWATRTSLNSFVRKIKMKTKVTLVSMNAELSREGFTTKFTRAKRESELAIKSFKTEKRTSQRTSISSDKTSSTVKTIPFIPQLTVERASEEIQEDVSDRSDSHQKQDSLKAPNQGTTFDLGSSPLRQRRLKNLNELNNELKQSPLPIRPVRQTVKFAGLDPLEMEIPQQKPKENEDILRSLDKETLTKLIMMTAAKQAPPTRTKSMPVPLAFQSSYPVATDDDNEYV